MVFALCKISAYFQLLLVPHVYEILKGELEAYDYQGDDVMDEDNLKKQQSTRITQVG